MAKLSGYLTGQLANPSYGGMLSRGIQGSMQGISDAYAQKRQRQGMESMNAILSNADPLDPNTVQSVQDVARQMHLDPNKAQAMIQNAQGQKRQQEQAVRAQEAAKLQQERMTMARDVHQYNQGLRKTAEAEKAAIKAGITMYNTAPEKVETILQNTPPEHRAAVQEAVSQSIAFKEQLRKVKEETVKREPFKTATLDEMAKVQGMEIPLSIYEKNKAEPGAKATLMRQFNAAQQASLYSKDKATPLREWEVKHATKLVNDADKGWLRAGNIPNDIQPALAVEVARRIRDGFQPTPENIRGMLEESAEKVSSEQQAPATENDDVINKIMAANPGSTYEEAEAFAKEKGYLK